MNIFLRKYSIGRLEGLIYKYVDRSDDMKNSVVMASYNGEKYVVKQLESIVEQSIPVDEIIIVDDLSTDNTCDIIEGFLSDKNIEYKLIRHKDNIGYKNTFLEALSYANGDIIFFADQDDIWKPDKVKTMCHYMEQNLDIQALNTGYVLIDANDAHIKENIKNKKRRKNNTGLEKVTLEQVLGYNVSMGCTLAVRKTLKDTLIEHINDIKTYNIPHDWMVNIVAAMSAGLYEIDDALIEYRLHGDNTIGLNRAATISKRIDDYKDIINQKKDMLKLLRTIDKKIFSAEYDYIKLMVKSYYIRCEMLERRSISAYIRYYIKYKLYKVMDRKTFLYDMYLMVRGIR